MRICIDARKIEDLGIGTYLRNLLEQIDSIVQTDEFYVIFHPADVHRYNYSGGKINKLVCSAGNYGIWEHVCLPRILRRFDIDLFHSPHYVTPLWNSRPTVVTIHDLIHLIYPQFLPSRPARWYAWWMMRRAVKHADRILTVSGQSKKDLMEMLEVSGDRIRVVPLAADKRFKKIPGGSVDDALRDRFNLVGGYTLYVGSFKPHKNVMNLIRAFNLVDRSMCERLVLVGDGWSRNRALGVLADKLGMTDRLVVLENIELNDLNIIYNGAGLFVFPSLYEGFGLPPLEAMQCETPVAASKASCIPEILGNAAVYFDPRSPSEIAGKIEEIMSDSGLKGKMITRGKKRAAAFSWSDTAGKTLENYREVSGR